MEFIGRLYSFKIRLTSNKINSSPIYDILTDSINLITNKDHLYTFKTYDFWYARTNHHENSWRFILMFPKSLGGHQARQNKCGEVLEIPTSLSLTYNYIFIDSSMFSKIFEKLQC
jgi:hypothetical protein